MTIVAWDGTTLAADRRVLSGRYLISGATTKIFRVRGALVGIAGSLTQSMARLAWLRDGAQIATFPESKSEDNRVEMLVIARDGTINFYGESPHPAQFDGPLFAIGSGEAEALTAMRCGRDAADAVRMVCETDASCGNGVDTLQFEENKSP